MTRLSLSDWTLTQWLDIHSVAGQLLNDWALSWWLDTCRRDINSVTGHTFTEWTLIQRPNRWEAFSRAAIINHYCQMIIQTEWTEAAVRNGRSKAFEPGLSAVCHCVSLCVAVYQLCVTVCNCVSLCVNCMSLCQLCVNCVSLCVTVYHRVSLYVTMCQLCVNCMSLCQLCVTVCHCMSLCVNCVSTVCHCVNCVSLCVTVCHCMSLCVNCMSLCQLCVTVCHLDVKRWLTDTLPGYRFLVHCSHPCRAQCRLKQLRSYKCHTMTLQMSYNDITNVTQWHSTGATLNNLSYYWHNLTYKV